jgi:hypothetical protein
VLGDLAEEYARLSTAQSRSTTNRWYYKEVSMILMHALFANTTRAFRAIVMNAVAIAIFWLTGFAANYLLSEVIPTNVILSVTTAIAIAIAVRLHARPAAFFLAAMLAFAVAELIAHTMWGYGVVQGAQTHFTIMGAGILGVVFGGMLVRYSTFSKAMNEVPRASA